MVKNIFKNYVYPIATLSGSIIGVGFLSLPYITLKVGIWPMLFYFVALTALVLSIHVIFGQISLKTPDYKRFPGFVEYYLGTWPKMLALALLVLGSFGVMLVYIIVGGQFLTGLLQPFLGGASLWYALLYFLAASAVIFFGIKTISKFELWSLAALLAGFFIICAGEVSHIKLANIFVSRPFFSDWKTMFLPYGAIIFSLWGIGLIPETEEMVISNKKFLRKIIIIATLIPAALYLLFTLLIFGISGSQTTEFALIGLQHFLPPGMFLVAIFVGLVATFTAFVSQGLLLKKSFMYDMKMPELPAWFITCFAPLILFFLGFNSFISLISFLGGVVLGINGLLILLMYKKVGGKKAIIYPLGMVFLLGVVYQVVYSIK